MKTVSEIRVHLIHRLETLVDINNRHNKRIHDESEDVLIRELSKQGQKDALSKMEEIEALTKFIDEEDHLNIVFLHLKRDSKNVTVTGNTMEECNKKHQKLYPDWTEELLP